MSNINSADLSKADFTVEEVAEQLRISKALVLRFIENKTLFAYKIKGAKNGSWRIPQTSIPYFKKQMMGENDMPPGDTPDNILFGPDKKQEIDPDNGNAPADDCPKDPQLHPLAPSLFTELTKLSMEKEISGLKREIAEDEDEIESIKQKKQERQLDKEKGALEERARELDDKEQALDEREEALNEQDNILTERENELESVQGKIEERYNKLRQGETDLKEKEERLKEHGKTLTSRVKQQVIEKLQDKISEAKAIEEEVQHNIILAKKIEPYIPIIEAIQLNTGRIEYSLTQLKSFKQGAQWVAQYKQDITDALASVKSLMKEVNNDI